MNTRPRRWAGVRQVAVSADRRSGRWGRLTAEAASTDQVTRSTVAEAAAPRMAEYGRQRRRPMDTGRRTRRADGRRWQSTELKITNQKKKKTLSLMLSAHVEQK